MLAIIPENLGCGFDVHANVACTSYAESHLPRAQGFWYGLAFAIFGIVAALIDRLRVAAVAVAKRLAPRAVQR